MNIIEPEYTWANALTKREATNYIVLHHTAGKGMSAEGIHQAHLANGWAGIGYHFYVRKDGSIYRGRPIDTAGAHCVNFNDKSVGISAEGNFENEAMSELQKTAIAEVLRHVLSLYPGAVVVRHRDMNQTACPGALYPFDGIVSLATTNRLAEAIAKLQAAGVIASPEYWLLKARPGEMCKGEYVAELIKNFASKI